MTGAIMAGAMKSCITKDMAWTMMRMRAMTAEMMGPMTKSSGCLITSGHMTLQGAHGDEALVTS